MRARRQRYRYWYKCPAQSPCPFGPSHTLLEDQLPSQRIQATSALFEGTIMLSVASTIKPTLRTPPPYSANRVRGLPNKQYLMSHYVSPARDQTVWDFPNKPCIWPPLHLCYLSFCLGHPSFTSPLAEIPPQIPGPSATTIKNLPQCPNLD